MSQGIIFILKSNRTTKSWKLIFRTFVLFICFYSVKAQNSFQDILPQDQVETIKINANQIFKIEVSTHDLHEIHINSQIDGEYQQQFLIAHSIQREILSLQLEQNPVLSIPDDKRNAHKVIAAKLQLLIPKGLNIDIKSDIASVFLAGSFKMVTIQLLEGLCHIEGNAIESLVNTVEGNITVKASDGKVMAKSRYGTILLDSLNTSDVLWSLESIRGNIKVLKKE